MIHLLGQAPEGWLATPKPTPDLTFRFLLSYTVPDLQAQLAEHIRTKSFLV
jgi:hypothetical protein